MVAQAVLTYTSAHKLSGLSLTRAIPVAHLLDISHLSKVFFHTYSFCFLQGFWALIHNLLQTF